MTGAGPYADLVLAVLVCVGAVLVAALLRELAAGFGVPLRVVPLLGLALAAALVHLHRKAWSRFVTMPGPDPFGLSSALAAVTSQVLGPY